MTPLLDSQSKSEQPCPKIEMRGLWKVFGAASTSNWRELVDDPPALKDEGMVAAVKDVSLKINPGETFVIMGLSGSGKSTLLRCVNNLVRPTAGEVLIDGDSVSKMNTRQLRKLRRHKMGMVFQHFALFPFRTVADNVAFGLEIRGVSRRDRRRHAMEALSLIGLEDWAEHYPSELSGGMQQRVGLARALAGDPEILLLDEPFSALDPLIRRELQTEFVRLTARVKKTVIFVTHDLNEAILMADRIAIMQEGNVVQCGTPREIVTSPATDYVSAFVSDVPRLKVLVARNVTERPELTLAPDSLVADAIRRMEEVACDHGFVIDGDRYGGIITLDGARAADGNQSVASVAITEVPRAEPDTPLEELVHTVLNAEIPVAVANGDGRFWGVLTRESILDQMAKPEEQGDDS